MFVFLAVAVICISGFVSGKPTKVTPTEAYDLLTTGGLLSYDVDVSSCTTELPDVIPVYSWGDRVDDVVYFGGNHSGNFAFSFSIVREINGQHYRLKDSPLRFTQVTFYPLSMFVEITDVNNDKPEFIATGSIRCQFPQGGVTLYRRSQPRKELLNQAQIEHHLRHGFDLNYVLDTDKCSLGGRSWSGRISGYRRGAMDDIAITQTVDSAQITFILNVHVKGSDATVVMSQVDRLSRTETNDPLRTCKVGEGFRVFVHQDV